MLWWKLFWKISGRVREPIACSPETMLHGTNQAFGHFIGELELSTAFVKDCVDYFVEKSLLGVVCRQFAADPDNAGAEVA